MQNLAAVVKLTNDGVPETFISIKKLRECLVELRDNTTATYGLDMGCGVGLAIAKLDEIKKKVRDELEK